MRYRPEFSAEGKLVLRVQFPHSRERGQTFKAFLGGPFQTGNHGRDVAVWVKGIGLRVVLKARWLGCEVDKLARLTVPYFDDVTRRHPVLILATLRPAFLLVISVRELNGGKLW